MAKSKDPCRVADRGKPTGMSHRTDQGPIAIIGSGAIGQSWAIAFARAGHPVRLHDPEAGAVKAALGDIRAALGPLEAAGLLAGQGADAVAGRIAGAASLAEAVDGAAYVQENAPERLEVKRALFAELDAAAPEGAVIASSTSALLPSRISAGLAGAARCLVVHPLNPPHLIPAVEIVPSAATAPEAVEAACALMTAIGQTPIRLAREIDGFVMNRLQGALLDEAMALVAEGICAVEDVDVALRDGLARRWSFMGPFETIDLNAPGGVRDFLGRYAGAYAGIGAGRPNRHPWTGDLAERVIAARRAALPAEDLGARRDWRDRRLAALARHMLEQQAAE